MYIYIYIYMLGQRLFFLGQQGPLALSVLPANRP